MITDGYAPFMSPWIRGWGFLIALFGAIPAIVVLGAAETYDGAAGAWALILSAVGAVATLLIYDYIRRRKKQRRAQWQKLLAALELGRVDEMTSGEFEVHCGNLLAARNYRDVMKTPNDSARKKVDLTAISPEGRLVAVEVKHRRKESIGRPVVSKLHGDICGAPYKGHAGMIMTNAPATEDAHSYARELGIQIVSIHPDDWVYWWRGLRLLYGEMGWAGGIQGRPSMSCSRTSRAPRPCFLAVSM